MSRVDDIRAQYPDGPNYNILGSHYRDQKNLLVEILCELIKLNENLEKQAPSSAPASRQKLAPTAPEVK